MFPSSKNVIKQEMNGAVHKWRHVQEEGKGVIDSGMVCDGRGGGRFLKCDVTNEKITKNKIEKNSVIFFSSVFISVPTTRATNLKIPKDLNDAKWCE